MHRASPSVFLCLVLTVACGSEAGKPCDREGLMSCGSHEGQDGYVFVCEDAKHRAINACRDDRGCWDPMDTDYAVGCGDLPNTYAVALEGHPCGDGDHFACSIENYTTLLECSGGTWIFSQDCAAVSQLCGHISTGGIGCR